MARFPAFFSDKAVLPPDVREPIDRTPWETHLLAQHEQSEWFYSGRQTGTGAPWLRPPSDVDASFRVEPAQQPGMNGFPSDVDWLRFPETRVADVIATYLPWHYWGDDWGIYFNGEAFWAHVAAFALELPRSGGVTQSLAENVYQQVRAHELLHFEGEILGTEIEAAAQRAGYRDYLLTRYRFRNPWTLGAPEEVLATHREVWRATAGDVRKVARRLAEAAPPGYADWFHARDVRERVSIETAIAREMASGVPLLARWAVASPSERTQVPLYWRDGVAGRTLPPFLQRAVARLTPVRVRRYLEQCDFVRNDAHTSGHHEWYENDGVIAAFSVQRGEIPTKEHSPLAKALGFATPAALRQAMTLGTPPPVLQARTA